MVDYLTENNVPSPGVLPTDPEGTQIISLDGGFIKWVDGEEVLMHQIYVERDKRRSGVGRKLMQELYKIAQGRPMISYSSADENNPFYHFMISEGWEQIDWTTWIK